MLLLAACDVLWRLVYRVGSSCCFIVVKVHKFAFRKTKINHWTKIIKKYLIYVFGLSTLVAVVSFAVHPKILLTCSVETSCWFRSNKLRLLHFYCPVVTTLGLGVIFFAIAGTKVFRKVNKTLECFQIMMEIKVRWGKKWHWRKNFKKLWNFLWFTTNISDYSFIYDSVSCFISLGWLKSCFGIFAGRFSSTASITSITCTFYCSFRCSYGSLKLKMDSVQRKLTIFYDAEKHFLNPLIVVNRKLRRRTNSIINWITKRINRPSTPTSKSLEEIPRRKHVEEQNVNVVYRRSLSVPTKVP